MRSTLTNELNQRTQAKLTEVLAPSTDVSDIQEQLAVSREATRQSQLDMLAAMSRLQRDRATLETEIDRLRDDVDTLQTEITSLRTELATQLNAPVAA